MCAKRNEAFIQNVTVSDNLHPWNILHLPHVGDECARFILIWYLF